MAIAAIVAYTAATIGTIQQLPQLYKTVVTKKVSHMSWMSLFLVLLTSVLWLIYGYIIYDLPLLISGAIATVLNVVMFVLYHVYI